MSDDHFRGPDGLIERTKARAVATKEAVRVAQEVVAAAKTRGAFQAELFALNAVLDRALAERREAKREARETQYAFDHGRDPVAPVPGVVLPQLPLGDSRAAMVAAGILREAPAPPPRDVRVVPEEVVVLLPEPPEVQRASRGPCGKSCWSSRDTARAANARARFRTRPYYCDRCRAWHVTNADKGGRYA